MIKDYFLLAVKSLVNKKIRSWLTLLGIFIGVAAVVGLIGLGEGLRTAITSQFGISNTEVLSVQAGGLSAAGPPGTGVVNPLTVDDVEAIERIGSVRRAIRRNIETGSLEFNNVVGFGNAMNVPDWDDRKFVYDVLEVGAEEGRMLKDGDTNKIVLGYNFYSGSADFGKKMRIGDNVLIQGKKFEIIGFLQKKGSFIFDNMVLMNEKVLKATFGTGDQVDVVAVQVKNTDLMNKAKEDIEKVLRKRRDVKIGEEDFSVETPQSAMSSLNDILVGVQVFIVIIASISIIIGAIGIVNTMFTSVTERRPEIGAMKALGAKNADIFSIFFIESGLMGLMGGLVGTIIGTSVSYVGTVGINNWINSSVDPQINFGLIFGALFGGFVIGAVAGIVPAMRAAKQNPVDALRG